MLVRGSFFAFSTVLIVAGILLLLKLPNIFPWTISPEQSVLYGWIFLGAATYFLYTQFKPVWGNATGQLVGFLIYDLILIVPLVLHFSNVAPEMFISLVIYVTILTYSGLLAIYFLFINASTRLSRA